MQKENDKILHKKLIIVISVIIIAILAFCIYNAVNENIEQSKNEKDVQLMREQAIIKITENIDKYTEAENDKEVKAWLVDAAKTKTGTIKIVDIEPVYQEKAPSSGIITREKITDTCKVQDMVITIDEIS